MTPTYLPWSDSPTDPDRPCVRDEREELTYAQLGERVDAAAEQFAELGITRGSVVAVMLPNRVELLISILAAWRLGAAATPMNPTFTETEALYQLADANADLLVASTGALASTGRATIAVEELRKVAHGTELPAPETRPDDLALLVYTSGSTGQPKGVMLAHSNLQAMASTMVAGIELSDADHCLLVLPLFHVNAICVSFLATMLAGGQLSILARFQPVEFLRAIERLRPTYFSAVPTVYGLLLGLPDDVVADTSSIRFAICGAAPASMPILEGVEQRFGFPIVEGYGLTEGTCASTANPVSGLRKPGTVGPALPGQTVAIMNQAGELVPVGERGEVVIRGDNVMQGYLGRPEATAETLVDGWLHTGDVGILDEDGYLTVVDRIKDMIIRGGENLYPQEIEQAIHRHPAVLEAAVVGRPDPLYGEVPVAYVAPRPGHDVTDEELLAVCAQHLTKVKIPAINLVTSLPKNPVGKIDKPALRALVRDRLSQGA